MFTNVFLSFFVNYIASKCPPWPLPQSFRVGAIASAPPPLEFASLVTAVDKVILYGQGVSFKRPLSFTDMSSWITETWHLEIETTA